MQSMNSQLDNVRGGKLRALGRFTVGMALVIIAGGQSESQPVPQEPVTEVATPSPVPDDAPPIYEPTRFPLSFVTDRSDLDGSPDFDSYYGLLDYVRHVDPAALQQAAEEVRARHWRNSEYAEWPLKEFPFYYDLTKRPESYRGQPISLTGHIQLHHVDHVENKYGLDPVHVAYLYTDDSQHHPARIVFTENPDQIPVGEQIVSGIHVTGYFLKLYRYADRDGKGRFMPLVLARSIRWLPPQPVKFSLVSQLAMAATAVGVLGGLFWWIRSNQRRDAEARQREQQLLGEHRPPDFSGLE